MPPAPIVVSGATGNIGRHVVRGLVGAGMPVRAMVRDPQRALPLLGTGPQLVRADLDQPESLPAAVRGAGALLLLGPPHPRQVEQQVALLRAAVAAGVRRVVKVSAFAADAGAPALLSRLHAAIEAQVRRAPVTWTLLQPHFFMQNLLADPLVARGALCAPAGGGAVAMIDARDVADVAVLCLLEPGHAGRTWVLTGPEAVTYAEVAATLSEVLGRPVAYVDRPPESVRAGMTARGMPDWLADDMLQYWAYVREGHGALVTDAVPRITGRAARSLRRFVREHADRWSPVAP